MENILKMNRSDRIASLHKSINERILVLDGAMGTAIQDLDLKAEDFGGTELEGCNENLVFTRPDAILQIHKDYLNAGADIVETNTFGGTPLVLDEYDIGSKAHELNVEAAKLARKAADEISSEDRIRFVAGSIGPTTKAISVTGGVSFQELIDNFYVQAKGLYEGGADYFLIETSQDTRNVKAAVIAISKLHDEVDTPLPVAVSGTIEPMGTMLGGQSVEALYASLAHLDLLYIGLNCATGPEFMTDHIRSLAQLSKFPISCVPNAGLPDEDGNYLETPEMIASVIDRFVSAGWINFVGGCCGTTPKHITALHSLVKDKAPRKSQDSNSSYLSGIDYLEIADEMRPLIVGERTNVIGSRKFKRLITEEKYDEASEVARAQIKSGAHIIDICLANPDRDEREDMEKFLSNTIQKIRVPMMIDSTDESVIEMSLTYSQGKSIINSINLEDGEERFEKVVPLAKRFGAALVVGTIDDDPDQGMGVTVERKLEIAKRSYALLTEKYGVAPEDIYWDPLVFPCATGDEQYIGSAEATIKGVKAIKEAFPKTKTVLGISNVSFGLPPAGREVLNSVFLYHCVQSGLDLAIVNSEKLERYASISDEEKKLADDLLFNRGEDPIAAFANHFRDRTSKKAESNLEGMSLDERLAYYIVEGTKDGLVEDLDLALKDRKPLSIINGPLMAGMDEVGKLFNDNRLIVAEVLQSAEAMKAAVNHLEPFMEKADAAGRGKILLATVKGDVHDIGKNLVEIVLANNGFEVVNLGIKIPPEQLIKAVKEHRPDMIGLSGLLVKSALQMITTAEDLSKAGIDLPILVGGAALSRRFTNTRIHPNYSGQAIYASDAMSGLDLAKQWMDKDKRPVLIDTQDEQRRIDCENRAAAKSAAKEAPMSEERSNEVPVLEEIPQAPDFERHLIRKTPIDQIWAYINPLMLYGRHLGIKGGIVKKLAQMSSDARIRSELTDSNPRAVEIWDKVQEVKNEFRNSDLFQPSAIYQFFHASSCGNKLKVWSSEPDVATVFEFPRQRRENGLCLSDYVLTEEKTKELGPDNIAFFAVTAGKGVREFAEDLKEKGDYLKSHVIQALALETAEGYAEYLHSQIRRMWGHPDPVDMTMMQRFQAKYVGKRYSFGYPACPKLDDQKHLWQLIGPNDIGIELTDGFMMDPEASVSAIVFHHPDAVYFSVGDTPDCDNRS